MNGEVQREQNKHIVLNDEVLLTSKITLTKITRQDKLRIWLLIKKITFQNISNFLGIAVSNARQLCLAETAPPFRVEQLKNFGIPEELLPEARYVPSGPKPKPKKD